MSNDNVLVVDDEASVRDSVVHLLKGHNLGVTAAPDSGSALELARQGEYDVAIVDLGMPGLSGMDTIRGLKQLAPDTEVIILTGHATLEVTLEALHEHVFDFLCKPVEPNVLLEKVEGAIERRGLIRKNRDMIRQLENERERLRKEAATVKRVLAERFTAVNMPIGNTEAMARVRRLIAEVAPSDMTVLIRGESGTGKDVVARLIHQFSGRGESGAFVKVNCPAIPEMLLESEMFGHERGAFTGAATSKPGRFELAAEGTIFLDEIGAIPLSVQAKLLQVLEHKEFTRVGGKDTISVDARIIAATNAPLEEMISDRKFRSDLFYRLHQFTINLPPLRERVEDIPPLVEHFLPWYANKYGRENLSIPPEVTSRLITYPWPGNVRQLEAIIARFALGGDPKVITDIMDSTPGSASFTASASTSKLEQQEVQTILSALVETKWNRRKAAKLLGISYGGLRRRIAKYNLE